MIYNQFDSLAKEGLFAMEYDYYPEEEAAKKGFSFGKLLKFIGIGLVIFVYLLVFFRIFINTDTKKSKKFIWDERAIEAYNQDPDSFEVLTQKLDGYVVTDGEGGYKAVSYSLMSRNGYFTVGSFVYVKTTSQVQLTLRYSNSALKALAECYSLETLPEKSDEVFCFALYDGERYYTEYSYTTDARFTYNYRRLLFEGIDLEALNTLSLCIYYVNDCDDLDLRYKALKSENDGDDTPVLDTNIITFYDKNESLEKYKLSSHLPPKLESSLKKGFDFGQNEEN